MKNTIPLNFYDYHLPLLLEMEKSEDFFTELKKINSRYFLNTEIVSRLNIPDFCQELWELWCKIFAPMLINLNSISLFEY